MSRVFGNVLSPFARKVYLALDFKGVDYEAIDVLPHADAPGFLAASPLGLVPAFEDDEVRISDSSVICDYLEQKYPEPQLYPSGRVERSEALWIEEYADSRLRELLLDGLLRERVANPLVRGIAPDEERVQRILDEQLPRELDYLESRLGAAPFFVGDAVSIADFAVITCFISARSAGFEVDAKRWRRLAGYLAAALDWPVVARRLEVESEYLSRLRG